MGKGETGEGDGAIVWYWLHTDVGLVYWLLATINT